MIYIGIVTQRGGVVCVRTRKDISSVQKELDGWLGAAFDNEEDEATIWDQDGEDVALYDPVTDTWEVYG